MTLIEADGYRCVVNYRAMSVPRMTAPVSDDMHDLVGEPALDHVSYANDAGQTVVFPMWVEFDGNRLPASSPEGTWGS